MNENERTQKSINAKTDSNKSPYIYGILGKYNHDFAIWNFMEVLTFGKFINFYKYYCRQNKDFDDNYKTLLFNVNCLRNACAHNNCLINNFRSKTDFSVCKSLKTYLNRDGIPKDIVGTLSKHYFLHDFAALLALYHHKAKSEKMIFYTFNELKLAIARMNKNTDYFCDNQIIMSRLNIISALVNIYASKCGEDC